jgi:hypothetical protein
MFTDFNLRENPAMTVFSPGRELGFLAANVIYGIPYERSMPYLNERSMPYSR